MCEFLRIHNCHYLWQIYMEVLNNIATHLTQSWSSTMTKATKTEMQNETSQMVFDYDKRGGDKKDDNPYSSFHHLSYIIK